jgi:chorismate mutase
MACRGIRGAITVDKNDAETITDATRLLLEQIVKKNDIRQEDVASMMFSVTSDLNAVYPAKAVRELGWAHIALMCVQEMDVAGSLSKCIRLQVLWNTEKSQEEINHIYLGEARQLRPDLAN